MGTYLAVLLPKFIGVHKNQPEDVQLFKYKTFLLLFYMYVTLLNQI